MIPQFCGPTCHKQNTLYTVESLKMDTSPLSLHLMTTKNRKKIKESLKDQTVMNLRLVQRRLQKGRRDDKLGVWQVIKDDAGTSDPS